MPEESKDYELFAAETTRNRRNPGKSDWRKENWMRTQAEKGNDFRALHERDSAFIIPNPWDVGTARLLAHLGLRRSRPRAPDMRFLSASL
jgi:hypothetical protein